MKKFGYPFTVFIYINYVGSGGKSLSWEQLAEMRDGADRFLAAFRTDTRSLKDAALERLGI